MFFSLNMSWFKFQPPTFFCVDSPIPSPQAQVLNGPAPGLLTSAFGAMGRTGPRGAPTASSAACRGGRARLLGRCFTVAAQMGRSNVVTLALRALEGQDMSRHVKTRVKWGASNLLSGSYRF